MNSGKSNVYYSMFNKNVATGREGGKWEEHKEERRMERWKGKRNSLI